MGQVLISTLKEEIFQFACNIEVLGLRQSKSSCNMRSSVVDLNIFYCKNYSAFVKQLSKVFGNTKTKSQLLSWGFFLRIPVKQSFENTTFKKKFRQN